MGATSEYANQAISNTLEENKQGSDSVPVSPETEKCHIILSAWGIPSPVNVAEPFIVQVGARCPENHSLAGLGIIVTDDKGKQVTSAQLSDKVLAGTSGTYYAELELMAPQHENVYTWKIACVPPETQAIFQAEAIHFSFRTAQAPEYKVSVEVIASRDKSPIETANVMLGLHRSFTDGQGIAFVEVPGGKQMLRVSKQDFRSYEEEVTISGDSKFTIDLVYDPSL